jgi:hypothetical protein
MHELSSFTVLCWFQKSNGCFGGQRRQRILLFMPENDPAACQVVGTHLYTHLIAGQNPDVVHSHFARDGADNLMPVFKPNPEHGI